MAILHVLLPSREISIGCPVYERKLPVKASNLNNPSRRFQEVSGLTFNIPCITHEFFHFDDLPTTIQATRRAASACMRQLGLTPIDDFTFIHPPPTVATTSPPSILSPLHPPSVVDQDCDDSTTADSMSILTHNEPTYIYLTVPVNESFSTTQNTSKRPFPLPIFLPAYSFATPCMRHFFLYALLLLCQYLYPIKVYSSAYTET